MSLLKKIKNKLPLLAFFIVMSFMCTIPIIVNGEAVIRFPIDLSFHLSRTMSLSDIWKTPVNFQYFNHLGIPMALFYPWLFVYPLYLLIQFVGNMAGGYYIYCTLVSFATLLISYYVGHKISGRRLVGVLFSVIYTFALYRQSNVYYRHAVGEFLALMFLPLVILGIYYVLYDDTKRWLILAIGMTGLAYTHELSLLMASMIVFFFLCLVFIRRQLTKPRFLALVKAGIVAVLLSGGYLFPLMEQQAALKLVPPVGHVMQVEALDPINLLMSSVNNQLGKRNHVLGLIPLILCIVLIYFFVTKKIKQSFVWDATLIGFICVWMSTSLFPWELLQKTPLRMIQFPWRFMGLATLLLSLAGIMALINHQYLTKKAAYFIIPAIVLLNASMMCNYLTLGAKPVIGSQKPTLTETYTSQQLEQKITNGSHFVGDFDYTPKAAQQSLNKLKKGSVLVDGQSENKMHYTDEAASCTIKVGQKTTAKLPILGYKGMRVTNNGKVVDWHRTQEGTIGLPLHEGDNHIRVTMCYTRLAKVSAVISLFTLIGMILMWTYRQRKIK